MNATSPRLRALCYAALIAAFWPTLRWSWDAWMLENGYYGHGPFLVAVALYFLYGERARWRAAPPSKSWLGFVLLVFFLVAHVAGQALLVDGLSGLALVPALLALTLAIDGPARLRVLCPALGCLAFAVPLPIFVMGKLAYALKSFATAASVGLGNLFGLGLEQDGARIFVPGQVEPLLVGDACSGLRSLVALIALGWVFAFYLSDRKRKPWSRLLLVAAAVPVALLANVVRITTLAILAKFFGTDFATGTAHDVSGYAIYLVALVLLFTLDRVVPGRNGAGRQAAGQDAAGGDVTERGGQAHAAASKPAGSSPAIACLATTLLFGTGALLLAFSTPGDKRQLFASRVRSETPRFKLAKEHDFPASWYDLLGTRDVSWRRYRAQDGGTLDVTAIFQGATWKSLHPPEVCLQSAGYEIVDTALRSAKSGEERFGLTMLEALRARTRERYLISYVFVGEDFKTPSYLSFFFRNIPSALFRREARAVLLRIDAPWPEGEARDRVEARIGMFYEDMLPSIQELVRS